MVSAGAMKNHDQKALGKERAYLAYTLALLFITKGSQAGTQTGQDPEAGANAEGIEGGFLLASFPWFAQPTLL